MREQFEQKKTPEQQVTDIITLVEGELADGLLYSEEHRDDLLRMLVTALTLTSNAEARAKIDDLIKGVIN